MKQAIEEGFILDVLVNYTTYKSYYELIKSIEDNPQYDEKESSKSYCVVQWSAILTPSQ